jgi:hypothetical protein
LSWDERLVNNERDGNMHKRKRKPLPVSRRRIAAKRTDHFEKQSHVYRGLPRRCFLRVSYIFASYLSLFLNVSRELKIHAGRQEGAGRNKIKKERK